MKVVAVDPFKFQKDILEWLERREDGNYVLNRSLLIDLKLAPNPLTNGANKSFWCVGKNWALFLDGELLVKKGFVFNGSNVVPDQPCKMLAAMVHDILCEPVAAPCYSYWRRQCFYRDIMKAQGAGWLLRYWEFAGVLLGQWI